MEKIQNYKTAHSNSVQKCLYAANTTTSVPAFKGTQNEVQQLSNVTPDYNVKTPMAYKFIKDIKISDNLIAKQYKLANGQNVVILPKDGPTFVKTYVNTGSFNEPDNLRGISHYIEHNLFNGSEDLGDKVFFDEVNKMGANTNASTSFSVTDYFVESNLLDDTDLENSIKLHAGMIQSPKFLTDKLEKEKKIVNSEINMYMAEDESLGFTQTIKNLYNIKSSSLDLVAGTTDNISALKRDDVVKYFNDNYYPANMTTVITGEVAPDTTMKLVSKYFTSNKMPQGERHFEKMTPIEKTVRQDIISPKSEGKASIFLGFAGPENNNAKDKLLLQAVMNIAGGLSNSRTHDIEIKYGAGIGFAPERLSSRPDDRNVLMVETKVPDDKVEPMLKDLYQAIDNLSKNPPSDDELTAVKNLLKKSHNKMFEMSGALNYHIGNAFLNNSFEQLTDYDKMVDEMTAQDIAEAAKKYLNLNKAALTVVHPSIVTAEQVNNNYKKLSEVSFTGANKKTPIDINNITKYRMSNNFEVTFNDTNNDNVTYKLTLKAKDWTPKKAAVADMLDEMLMTSGTKDIPLSGCSKTEDRLALDTGLAADQYGLIQGANFPVDSSKEAFKYLDDRIKNPDLNEKVFKECVNRLLEAYTTHEVSPYDKYVTEIYKGTPQAFTNWDKLASLPSITLDDVKQYYNEIFQKGMGQVTVSGPFSKHPELKQQVFDALGGYAAVQPFDVTLPQVYTPVEKPIVFTAVNKKNQAKILQGYKFKQTGNIKDKMSVELLNEILGGSASSRLFSDLREKRHLAYSVHSDTEYSGDTGVITLSIGTTTENLETGEKTFDNVKKSIEGFNENIKKITTEKVTPEELDSAKRSLKSILLDALETSADKNGMITASGMTPYGVDYINKALDTIDKITADDIYNAANYIFNSNPVYSLTATQATIDANKDFLAALVK